MTNWREACAACTHQRRSCSSSCNLAPYFPIERMEDFMNVHQLYGINRFLKIIESVSCSERSKTAETIILEARMRKSDPAHGSLAVANQIEEEKNLIKEHIEKVEKDIEFIKKITAIGGEIEDLEVVLESDPLELVSLIMEEEVGPSQSTQHAGENSNTTN